MGRRDFALFASAALTMTVAGCAAEADEASGARELLALTKTYNAAWERLDADAIMRFHPDDIHYYWYGSEIASRTQFEKVLRQEILPNLQPSPTPAEIISPHVEMLGPNAGVVSFRSRGKLVSKSGTVQDVSGAGTYIFERRSGRWMIVHIHESGKTPPQ